jgi:hypothetical protein
MNCIFILGAGASADARAPLMHNFLERAYLIQPGSDAAPAFRLVAKARSLLQQAQSKAQLDIRNVESVFASFEMARLFGRLGDLGKDELQRLVPAMRKLIVYTIERYMTVRIRNGQISAPPRYDEFGALVKLLKGNGHRVSIATFNYDVGADMGLWLSGLEVDYCLRQEPTDPHGGAVELMKLHGSFNWGSCTTCNKMIWRGVSETVGDAEKKWRKEGTTPQGHITSIPIERIGPFRYAACPVCKTSSRPDPFIVSPTPNKSELHQGLQTVWERAALRLAEADNIFIIGYSWPDGDHFFHQLYALGTIGATILSRLWVCDPKPEVRRKFKDRLLGQQAVDCFGPTDEAYEFNSAIGRIASEFELGTVQAPKRRADQG